MVAVTLNQLPLGAVYSWSVFSAALRDQRSVFRLTAAQAALPFSVTIAMMFVGSYLGGRFQDRRGPRAVALTGGVVYAAGILLASLARGPQDLWVLLLGYGVVAGFGLGVGYIVPTAMLQKWFPDKRGLITGIAAAGFGLGSVVTSPVAATLVAQNPRVPTHVFLPLGLAYLAATTLSAWRFRSPPPNYAPPVKRRARHALVVLVRDHTLNEALRTPQWYLLTAIFCLNITAGIGLISVITSSAGDIAGYSAESAAVLTGIMGLFNGGGRILWGWGSEQIGRMNTFLAMLALQGVCFLLLPHARAAFTFAALVALIVLCFGGGFGTMPAAVADFFGLRHVGAIYGLMMIGLSVGGVAGPLLIARLVDAGSYTTAFTAIALITLTAMILPVITWRPHLLRGLTSRTAEQS